MPSFSDRFGFAVPEPEVTLRFEAPEELRSVLLDIAYRAGCTPTPLRQLVCEVLFKKPDIRSNWSDPNVKQEIVGLLEDCAWWDVYNIIEAIAKNLQHPAIVIANAMSQRGGSTLFTEEINRYLRRVGIGWQLKDGLIEYRGTESFESTVRMVAEDLASAGRTTAARELHEAITDLSRRPEPEVTGAIQHAMAALECVARDVGHTKDTLGEILRRDRMLFPPPIDAVVEKTWGWTSNYGRHLQEGSAPRFEEAELAVGLAGALCRYLKHKLK